MSAVPECVRCLALNKLQSLHETQKLGYTTVQIESVRELLAQVLICAGRLCGPCFHLEEKR